MHRRFRVPRVRATVTVYQTVPVAVDLVSAVQRAGFADPARVWLGLQSCGSVELTPQPLSQPAYCASIGKQLTAACLALTVQRGQLAEEDVIGSWVPGLPAWAQRVTISQLLHHASGLPSHAATFDVEGDQPWTTDAALSFLRTADLQAPPGERYSYSGLGYVLLAQAVEKAAGERIEALAGRLIFGPLSMADTRFWSGPGAQPPGSLPIPHPYPAPLSIGDGGLWSTVPDLLRWGSACNADTLGITARITRTAVLSDGTPNDYGWGARRVVVDGAVCWSHGGRWPGVTTKLIWVPDAKLVLAASADGDVDQINALANDVLREALAT